MSELTPSDAINLVTWILGLFITLIGVIVTLYKWNIEKTIKAQAELTNQKIDLTHELIKSTISDIRKDNEDIKEIAITAHQAVGEHVLNYHRN